MAEPGEFGDPQRARTELESILDAPEFAGLERHWYTPFVELITDPAGTLSKAIDWFFGYVAYGSSNLWVAGALGLAFILFVTVGIVLLTRSLGSDAGAPVAVDLSPTGKSPEELEADADTLARKGDFEAAVRARFSALLLRLGRLELVQLRSGLTTGEYRSQLSTTAPSAVNGFSQAVDVFDRIWFGGHVATNEDVEVIKSTSLDVLAQARNRMRVSTPDQAAVAQGAGVAAGRNR